MFLGAIALIAGLASVRGTEIGPLPSHPRLLLNAEGVANLKARIAAAPWAAAEWKTLVAQTERELGHDVELPPRGGNWSHNYVCPIHGARLREGKQIGPWQWEHICPVGNHVLHGDPSKAELDFDGNGIAAVHGRLAEQIVNAGLIYQVTGDARYAAKARAILLAYADRYLAYELHDNQGRKGRGARVASQPLTEASWLISVVQGADLVWTTLSAGDQKRIADKLLMPALREVILPPKMGIHNIKCRLNSAVGLVGFLLNDPTLIAKAIDDPEVGYRQQLAKGVLDDGMWTEGSSGYHFFTMEGLWPLAEAARNCGLDLYTAKFQAMFDAPLAFARPDFVLPDFNDSGSMALQSRADIYELGFARFHNPAYVPLLKGSDRHNRMALLFGVRDLPSAQAAELGSRNSPASGYAILQQGSDADATWLCVKYGPHGGGHGHPDKNHFILYTRGEVVAPDGGTHAYGSPLHKDWDKITFAHNTLTVDEQSQQPAQGRSLAFGREQGVDFSITDAGPIYPGVRFVRTAAMLTPQLIVFVDQVQADAPHTLDLVYHQLGSWEDLPAGKPWPPSTAAGYNHLSGATVRPNGPGGITLSTKVGGNAGPGVVVIAGGEPTDIITGYGILKTTEDRVPLLMQRRHAARTAFVWAISLDGTPAQLRLAAVTDATGRPLDLATAALVTVSQADRRWRLLVNPEQQAISAVPAEGAPWRSEAAFSVR